MIDENKFLDAFGDIDDEFLLEEYDNYNKSKNYKVLKILEQSTKYSTKKS